MPTVNYLCTPCVGRLREFIAFAVLKLCRLHNQPRPRRYGNMAEVHLIGEIVGAEGFPSQNLFCKWGLSVGSAWEVLEGLQEGQTQVDHPQVSSWMYR